MRKEFIKVELIQNDKSQGSYIELPENIPDLIADELAALGEGDSIKLTSVSMTQEEVDAMPEFEGF